MNIVIIEDERVVADDLEFSINQLINGPVSIVQLHSVKEAIVYLKNNPSPDLIFSDIQLGDGLSFEIFIAVTVSAPVIFCTAYDEYALDAFKANGIDYILKPFTTQTLERALQRYEELKKLFSADQGPQYNALLEMLADRGTQKSSSVLVYHQDKIIPIKLEDIALFYLANEVTNLLTFSGKTFYPNKNLDELEKLSGNSFFRANRQFIINRKQITEVDFYFNGRLSVKIKPAPPENIIISKARVPEFKVWMNN